LLLFLAARIASGGFVSASGSSRIHIAMNAR
jgi:hypothetical protein